MEITFGDDIRLDRAAWYRLLGVSESHLAESETDGKMRAALERLQEQMEEAEDLLQQAARPRFTYCLADRKMLPVEGVSLQKHLEGCNRMVLMAVTLGEEVDQLISRTQSSKIALAVVIDSGASVMAELAAAEAETQIRSALAAHTQDGRGKFQPQEPLFMTSRFSPGYGDAPLKMQEQVLELLDAEEQLGITLSKGFMMSPSKSITAILGLSDQPVTGRLATCGECVLKDKCRLKKEGKRCFSTSRV